MPENHTEMTQHGPNSVQINTVEGDLILNLSQTEAIPYMDKECSATIIGLCKSIDVFLRRIGTSLLNNPSDFNDNYLVSNDFNGWLAKLKDFFSRFSTDALTKINHAISAKYPLGVLAEYIIALSPDISVEFNSFYQTRILYTIDCVYRYSEKSNGFFLALGALGLVKDYSDEKIFRCATYDLQVFFTMVRNILDTYTKEIDFTEIENNASSSMNDHIYHSIRFYFKKASIPALRNLLGRGKMVDTDLANEVGMSVIELRKILFPATNVFINYKYHTPNSTELWISEPYQSVIRDYYDKLFAAEDSL